MGREPRLPFRVGARCRYGYPLVIVSPCVLEDGERFPTCAWLTCPWLAQAASAAESSGEMEGWAAKAEHDVGFASSLRSADQALAALRAAESGGQDECAPAGIAGSAPGGGIKCVHARIAAALVGVPDPVGREMLDRLGDACEDSRCSALAREGC